MQTLKQVLDLEIQSRVPFVWLLLMLHELQHLTVLNFMNGELQSQSQNSYTSSNIQFKYNDNVPIMSEQEG